MVELIEKNFKIAIISMFKDVKYLNRDSNFKKNHV